MMAPDWSDHVLDSQWFRKAFLKKMPTLKTDEHINEHKVIYVVKKYERIRVGQYFWSCEACEASLLNKSKSEVYFVKFARKLRRTLFLVQMWWKSWFGANISPATWFLMFNLLIKSKIYLITSSGEWKIQIIIYDFDIDPDPLGPTGSFRGTCLSNLALDK